MNGSVIVRPLGRPGDLGKRLGRRPPHDCPKRTQVTAPANPDRVTSARHEELLELAYQHVLMNGLADMSLRPLAKEIGSSPRVLLFLFGSKDNLVRCLLQRARAEELAAIEGLRRAPGSVDLATVARQVWDWLAAPEHRNLLGLWTEAYARSLVDVDGPWAGFARQTVRDWLDLLASCQPPARRRSARGEAERTAVLALLRGAMLDLLATGDLDRTTRALLSHLNPPQTAR
jgi:AcrR family transcriptional regulator